MEDLAPSKIALVVAPHADDETIGCGGTLVALKKLGYDIYWVLCTTMQPGKHYSPDQANKRRQEIDLARTFFDFDGVFELGFEPAFLDQIPMANLVSKMKNILDEVRPSVVFAPYRYDAHSDHQVVYDALSGATKSFRSPFVKKLFVYETLSETEYSSEPMNTAFRPNVFFDISSEIDAKIEALNIYSDQVATFPFPRSDDAVIALSKYRGAQAFMKNAEAFMLIKDTMPFPDIVSAAPR